MKPRIDKSAYGVVIGFGGAALCVVLAVFQANGPAIRAWLFAAATPEFAARLALVIVLVFCFSEWRARR